MTAGVSHADWYRNGRLAPYVRARRVGGCVLNMLEAAQPAGDMSDPPVDDLVLIHGQSAGMRQTSDIGGGRFRATTGRGALFLVPPNVATRILVDDPHVVRGFSIHASRFADEVAEMRPGAGFDFGALHAGPFVSDVIAALLDRLWTTAESEGGGSRLHAEAGALFLLAELNELSRRPRQACRGGLAPRQLQRVLEYMREHLADDVSLGALAELAGLSQFHFCRMFRSSMGMPPHRWRDELRRERAEHLLGTDRSIAEIATAVGFGAPSAFANAFRRWTGVSPSRYRRQRRG